jgi:hypothetical protein
MEAMQMIGIQESVTDEHVLIETDNPKVSLLKNFLIYDAVFNRRH